MQKGNQKDLDLIQRSVTDVQEESNGVVCHVSSQR